MSAHLTFGSCEYISCKQKETKYSFYKLHLNFCQKGFGALKEKRKKYDDFYIFLLVKMIKNSIKTKKLVLF